MTEEIRVKGICLRAVEYGENDRVLTLLTDALGKITVRARGVSSAKSKLRHAATPFAFGEYILAVKGGFYSLRTFDYLDSFPMLSDDIFRYYCGAAALETIDKIDEGEVPDAAEFTCLLRFLSKLCYEGGDEGDFIPFVLDVLRATGYAVSVGDFHPEVAADRYVFDLEEGCFVASEHGSRSVMKLTTGGALLLNAYLHSVRAAAPSRLAIAELLSLFSMYIRLKTSKNLHSYFELAALLRGQTV